MILAHDLGYAPKDELLNALSEVSKLLEAYRTSMLED